MESYEGRRKTGLDLVDLTAACHTVWHQDLALKLLQTIPDWHLVRFIVNIISNRNFILKTRDGQCSGAVASNVWRTECPKGQRTYVFNIYISDIPHTVPTQYGYADDLALLFSDKCWNEVEEVLSLDMTRIADYLSAWRFRLRTAKTTCTAFNLNNSEAIRKLVFTVDGTTIPYNQNPTNLGVTLDGQLTFRQPLERLCGNVRAGNCLLRLLAGSTWGDHASILRTAALALVYTTVPRNTPPQLGTAASTLKS